MKKQPRFKSDKLRFEYINKFIKGKEILNLGSAEGYLHSFIRNMNSEKNIYSCDLNNSDFNRDLNKTL
jgi:23S rRNA U2552 (ribose-2'-O)-methylase RlmE/FtsJ